jgi:hypothetical protein
LEVVLKPGRIEAGAARPPLPAALVYAANHISAAEKAAQTVPSLHNAIQLRCTELIRDLNTILLIVSGQRFTFCHRFLCKPGF